MPVSRSIAKPRFSRPEDTSPYLLSTSRVLHKILYRTKTTWYMYRTPPDPSEALFFLFKSSRTVQAEYLKAKGIKTDTVKELLKGPTTFYRLTSFVSYLIDDSPVAFKIPLIEFTIHNFRHLCPAIPNS